jgi:DNA-binding NarL/FixJ family response regulator
VSVAITVLLVDDHALVRDALVRRLQEEPDIRVVDALPDASDVPDRVQQLGPDVLVLDIDLPGPSAFDAARLARDRDPGLRILFLSAYLTDQLVEAALAVQASGYVTKAQPIDTLVKAIQAAARGRIFFSPDVQARIVVGEREARLSSGPCTRMELLTEREREILRQIAGGLAKKEVARHLGISVKTVDRHCTHIMEKLGIHDRVKLAHFAIREGLVRP